MTSVLVPSRTLILRKVKSKQIVEDFLKMDAPRAEVEVEKTGRNYTSVYTSLHTWLSKHPELEVELAQENGVVVLYRTGARTNSTVCH